MSRGALRSLAGMGTCLHTMKQLHIWWPPMLPDRSIRASSHYVLSEIYGPRFAFWRIQGLDFTKFALAQRRPNRGGACRVGFAVCASDGRYSWSGGTIAQPYRIGA
jgi:hypothetical protein